MSAELAAASASANGLTSLFTVVAPVLLAGTAAIYTMGFIPGSEAFIKDAFDAAVNFLPGLEMADSGIHLNPNA